MLRQVPSRAWARPRQAHHPGIAIALALLAASCAGRGPAASSAGLGPVEDSAFRLLDGEPILQRACTSCHDLGGLAAFADYWGEPEWRSLMDTMISYGAELTPDEYEVLAAYLAERYGPLPARLWAPDGGG